MRILVTCACISYCLFAQAQKWTAAKILLDSSDTLRGEGILKYNTLQFRKDASSTAITYSPDQVRLIYIDNGVFASTDFIGLSAGEKSALAEPFFAEVLMSGDVDLYYQVTPANRDSPSIFFIKKGDEPALQLIKTIVMQTVNGVQYRKVNEAYRDQLKMLFNDCPSVIVDTRKDYYKEAPMLALVKSYVACRSNKSDYVKKVITNKAKFSVVAGITLSSMSTKVGALSPGTSYDYIPRSSSSTSPFFGVQLAVPLDRKEKLAAVTELVYSSMKASGTYQRTISGFQEEFATTNISRSYLRVNESLRRNLTLGNNLYANLHIGFSFSAVLSGSYHADLATTNTGNGSVSHFDYDLKDSFQSTEAGFFGGAGLNYKKIGLMMRYEQTLSFTVSTQFQATLQNIYIALTYKISK